jgi:hypothetical protein
MFFRSGAGKLQEGCHIGPYDTLGSFCGIFGSGKDDGVAPVVAGVGGAGMCADGDFE